MHGAPPPALFIFNHPPPSSVSSQQPTSLGGAAPHLSASAEQTQWAWGGHRYPFCTPTAGGSQGQVRGTETVMRDEPLTVGRGEGSGAPASPLGKSGKLGSISQRFHGPDDTLRHKGEPHAKPSLNPKMQKSERLTSLCCSWTPAGYEPPQSDLPQDAHTPKSRPTSHPHLPVP